MQEYPVPILQGEGEADTPPCLGKKKRILKKVKKVFGGIILPNNLQK